MAWSMAAYFGSSTIATDLSQEVNLSSTCKVMGASDDSGETGMRS